MGNFWDKINPVHVVNEIGDGVKKAVVAAGDTASDGVSGVKDGVSFVAGGIASGAGKAWEATSREAEVIGHAVESTGLTIGKGMIQGANAAARLSEEGVVQTRKGLVWLKKYATQHVCDIALGTALGALFTAWASSGEEEAAFGAVAAACATAKAMGEEAELNIASETAAKFMVGPIYMIPGVAEAVGHKDQFEEVLAFVISSTASQDPELVVGSAGQYIAGAVISTVTTIVCEGEVPVGGPQLWRGAQP